MFSALARRTLSVLPQVRLIRSRPSTFIPTAPARRKDRRRDDEGDTDIIVGETIDVKIDRFPKPKQKNFLEDPSVMTLVSQHRVEIDEDADAEPKVGYTDEELELFNSIAEIRIDDALRKVEDSTFDAEYMDSVGPGLRPTFNVAALAEKHEVIKQLVAMNVQVHKMDSKPEILSKIVALKWDDCKLVIEFLVQKAGVKVEDLGKIFSRNPCLLAEELVHLEARLEFLRDKNVGLGFRRADVERVVTKEAYWLSIPVKAIENRADFFRNQFDLDKNEFKEIIKSRPQIIMVKLRNLMLKKFSLVEEMGFSQSEIKRMIKIAPKVLTLNKHAAVERFKILHLDMGYSHALIVKHAHALYCRESRLKERHAFLKYLKRDQYDPNKAGYISPEGITRGDDERFVTGVAKSTKEKFEKFIKSL